MRAPPHGFSQLATSFFACPRLGIPRAPLPRLTSFPDPTGTARKPYRRNRESWPTSNDTHLRRSRFPSAHFPTRIVKKLVARYVRAELSMISFRSLLVKSRGPVENRGPAPVEGCGS